MSDKIGLFTGSFDPITKGHTDMIERASRLFDRLYVGIFYNQEKKAYFEINQREQMVTEALAHLQNIQVFTAYDELAVHAAKRLGVTAFVRGLRNGQDFDYEANLQFFNRELEKEIETVFLISKPSYQYISSSRIQELLAFGQDISAYVPDSVIKELEKENDEDN